MSEILENRFMKIITTFFAVIFFCLMCVSVSNAQMNNSADKPKDRPLQIKSKQRIDSSVFSRCFEGKRNTGIRAAVRVTFHSSGKVTEVEIAEPSGCESFDKEALRLARKIKFKPAVKDGVPITVVKTTEYGAYIY
jgi:TonB family protein